MKLFSALRYGIKGDFILTLFLYSQLFSAAEMSTLGQANSCCEWLMILFFQACFKSSESKPTTFSFILTQKINVLSYM